MPKGSECLKLVPETENQEKEPESAASAGIKNDVRLTTAEQEESIRKVLAYIRERDCHGC